MQPVGTGYTGMICKHGDGLYGEAWPSCASAMPRLGFEALIIKQVIRVYS